jgi:5-bromo-4-chloroindolyl phosphate hydrolysis protein
MSERMNDFFKMDVFFVVTTFVVVFGGILLIIGLFYLVRILKSIDITMRNVSEESDALRSDIAVLRQKVRDEGMKVAHVTDFFSRFTSRKTKTERKKKSDAE